MESYKQLIEKILSEGQQSGDRTGTGTLRIFGTSLEFDITEEFPILTLKYTHWPAIVHELLWFLQGTANIKYLTDNNVHIWDEWANIDGNVGPMYGAQWRNANGRPKPILNQELWVQDGVDQLGSCIDLIKNNPTSRRILVDCWNTRFLPDESLSPIQNVDLGRMALAPCHMFYQFFVEGTYLDIQVYQRSVDSFLGLPFNIASYALLLELVAMVTNKIPRKLKWLGGDTHLYSNHIDQAKEMINRDSLPLPYLTLQRKNNIDEYTYDDIELHDYNYHPAIKGQISV